MAEETIAGLPKISDFAILITVVVILAVIVIPLPGFMLDFFITISFSLALFMFFVSIYVKKPLEFSTFPSLLLAVTLYRLSLNIATTRAILLHGNESVNAAGEMIKTFGYFVVGGSYVVGFIVFIILIIINFIVITKGATRVAEVAARFTLDSMPGKQMSIDADLNAGLIDEETARRRRAEITRQADFYGAMDGASKFVRGDAIAGLLITAINIIGGIIIGVLQHHMNISQAVHRYTVLTIGDGLISQLPALTVSTAAGIIITRSSEEISLPENALQQLVKQYRVLYISAGILALMAFVPGMPKVPLFGLALVFALIAYSISYREKQKKAEEEREKEEAMPPEPEITPEDIEESIKVDVLELKIGYGLIGLVDEKKSDNLLRRIKYMRKKIAVDLGVIVPSIRIRDDLNLGRNEYVFLIKGVEVARYEIYPERFLAMKPGEEEPFEGINTKEPAFGLPAYWIGAERKEEAIAKGYTVIDPITVMITHITEIIKENIADIFTRQDAGKLLETLESDYPRVHEELFKTTTLGVIYKVLKNLLKEGIPIRDVLTIAETITDYSYIKDTDVLTEYVRSALASQISNKYKDESNVIHAITLGGNVEGTIVASIKEVGGSEYLDLSPNVSEKLLDRFKDVIARVSEAGIEPLIITSPRVRRFVRDFIERFFPKVPVISYSEITKNVEIRVVGNVEL